MLRVRGRLAHKPELPAMVDPRPRQAEKAGPGMSPVSKSKPRMRCSLRTLVVQKGEKDRHIADIMRAILQTY